VKAVAFFVVATLLSATITSLSSGCVIGGGDCECPVTPDRPGRQAALPIDEASAFNEGGNDDPLPTDPIGGTVDVTGDQLVIRYTHAGAVREVIYDVSKLR
jgi:hypothetical protein